MNVHTILCDDPLNDPQFHSFLNATICLRRECLAETLDNYRRRIGNAVNEYLYCCFARELAPDDPDYFGADGVAVYSLDPQADCTCLVVMDEPQFFARFTEAMEFHRSRFSDDEWDALREKLERLSTAL